MENKVFFKKYLLVLIIAFVVFTSFMLVLRELDHDNYTRELNYKISNIVEEVKERYPDVPDKELLDVIKNNGQGKDFLEKYGYYVDEDDLIDNSRSLRKKYLFLEIITISLFVLIVTSVFIKYNSRREREIDKIIRQLEKINARDYELEIENLSEDKLSILKQELYKTTVMLRSVAENSELDKIKLKDSLSDISHQLKTPITSILIMLDDIIEDEEMDKDTKDAFLKDIRRDVLNISFLVQSILKLSRIDASAIEFKNEECSVSVLVDNAIKNTSPIADLKGVVIKNNATKACIKCDENWQSEAISNILKNAIEHSPQKGIVEINVMKNDIFTEIEIKDHGDGIDKKDLKHIFDRFYKGATSSEDSIGIGLALAKTIIENQNGSIAVESKIKEGTTFKVRYFK